MNWREFLFDQRAPQLVRVIDIPTDPEAERRNAERAQEARERMGARWLLHPVNQVKRREAA